MMERTSCCKLLPGLLTHRFELGIAPESISKTVAVLLTQGAHQSVAALFADLAGLYDSVSVATNGRECASCRDESRAIHPKTTQHGRCRETGQSRVSAPRQPLSSLTGYAPHPLW